MVVDYKIVKYCGFCKKRFTVNKGEARTYYCPECAARFRRKENEKKEREEKEAQEKEEQEKTEK